MVRVVQVSTPRPNGADPLGTAVRSAARSDKRPCALCGETRQAALHNRVGHHVAGRRNDSLTVPVCMNCHAAQHENMATAGVVLTNSAPIMLDGLMALLGSLGAFLIDAGERLIAYAEALLQLIARLDASLPTWRTLDAGCPA